MSKHLSLQYLEWLESKACCMTGDPAVRHHMKAVGMGRNRKRPMPEHFTGIPLRGDLHTEYHAIGHRAFEEKHHINLWKVANLLLAEFLWELSDQEE